MNPAFQTQQFFIDQTIKEMQDQAVVNTTNSKINFEVAVSNAKLNGTPPPTSYIVYSVDAKLITALMTGVAGDITAWNRILVASQFTPPADPPKPPKTTPALPLGLPVGEAIPGTKDLFFALDVAPFPAFPDGSRFTDSRGTFIKHLLPAPFGFSSSWQRIKS